MTEKIKTTLEHPAAEENKTGESRLASLMPELFPHKIVTQSRRSEMFRTMSQDKALAMIVNPAAHIKDFKHHPDKSSDNWQNTFKRRTAHISGDIKQGGLHYPLSVSVESPGFIGRSLARVRRKQPQAAAFFTKHNIPREMR